MADAIPTTPGNEPKTQSTVVVQAPMSQWTALKQAGWWTAADTFMLVLLCFDVITCLYWKIFGDPETLHFVLMGLSLIVLLLVWTIMLIFRCSWFVLRLNADVATLPNEAARIAVAYLQGQAPPQRK